MYKSIWEILGIEPTSDKITIQEAFSKRSKEIHPEESPEEFKKLLNAYESAIEWSKYQRKETPILSDENILHLDDKKKTNIQSIDDVVNFEEMHNVLLEEYERQKYIKEIEERIPESMGNDLLLVEIFTDDKYHDFIQDKNNVDKFIEIVRINFNNLKHSQLLKKEIEFIKDNQFSDEKLDNEIDSMLKDMRLVEIKKAANNMENSSLRAPIFFVVTFVAFLLFSMIGTVKDTVGYGPEGHSYVNLTDLNFDVKVNNAKNRDRILVYELLNKIKNAEEYRWEIFVDRLVIPDELYQDLVDSYQNNQMNEEEIINILRGYSIYEREYLFNEVAPDLKEAIRKETSYSAISLVCAKLEISEDDYLELIDIYKKEGIVELDKNIREFLIAYLEEE